MTSYRSGQLPAVEEFAGYEQVLPGAADRILAMAEKAQDAAIHLDAHESVTIRWAYLMTSGFTAGLPWVALLVTIAMASYGQTGLAWAAGILATVSGAPQIYVNVRNAFNRGREHDGDGE